MSLQLAIIHMAYDLTYPWTTSWQQAIEKLLCVLHHNVDDLRMDPYYVGMVLDDEGNLLVGRVCQTHTSSHVSTSTIAFNGGAGDER